MRASSFVAFRDSFFGQGMAGALLAGAALGLVVPAGAGAAPRHHAHHAAAGLAAKGARAQRLVIAGLPAFALRDGALSEPNDGKAFVTGVGPDVAGQLLRANALPGDRFDFSLQTLLVRAGHRVMLFDTGLGTNGGALGGRLMASLALAGVRPDQVTDVFISHAHGDHAGGLTTPAGAAAFANATVHISAPEWDWVRSMSSQTAQAINLTNRAALLAAVGPRVVTFTPGATLVPGLVRAVPMPGHTPGHSAYLIGSGAGAVLFIGDTMHHWVTSVQHPEWTIAFDGDPAKASSTRVDSEARWTAKGQRLFAGHFPFPGYGEVVRVGTGYRWHPLPGR